MTFKRLFYAVGAVALLAGLWGIYTRFFVGEQAANYGSYVTWGLWVAMYLFFAGIAAGSFMMATLDFLFRVNIFKGTGKVMLWAALVALPAALASIGMDLGHMERIVKVYLEPNFSSMLAQMVWGYTIFMLVAVISLILAFRKPEGIFMKVVMIIGLAISIYVSSGVGALLGVNASRSYWHIGLFPVQFPFFSLASGAALMLVIFGWFVKSDGEGRNKLLWTVSILTVVLALVKLGFLYADYAQSLYGGVPENVQAVTAVMFGPYRWEFWLVQILLGGIIPIIILSQPKLAKNGLLVGLMGLLVLIGFAVARFLIVVPGLIVPLVQGLGEAFYGPHLSFEYMPSLMEWSVTSGVTGAAILAILLGLDYLSLLPKAEVKK
jgi:protein NrfD